MPQKKSRKYNTELKTKTSNWTAWTTRIPLFLGQHAGSNGCGQTHCSLVNMLIALGVVRLTVPWPTCW